MIFIFGKRLAKVGSFIDHDHICYPCKASDRQVLIHRPYFHLCFIPVFPIGGNEYSMHCRNCGDDTLMETVVTRYRGKVRTPWYLYSALILTVCLSTAWFYWNSVTTRHKNEYVRNPLPGDIYTIYNGDNGNSTYSFLRIIGVGKDSVKALQNHYDYGGFVSSLADDDYFVKDDTLTMNKKKTLFMLETGQIYSVERNMGSAGNFDRIKNSSDRR
jgi:hypothetical protein